MTASLYQRLGGAPVVAAVVDDVVDRHAANPALAPLFRGQDLPQLKTLAVDLFTAVAGAPGHISAAGGDPPDFGMGLSPAQLLAALGDVTDALLEQGVGAVEADEVVRLVCAASEPALRR